MHAQYSFSKRKNYSIDVVHEFVYSPQHATYYAITRH